MMAKGGGSKLWDLVTDRPIAKLAGPAEALERLQEEMVYKPLPEVRRLIFIATPRRGSPAIASQIRAVASRFVRPSDGLRQSYASLLAANGPDTFVRLSGRVYRRASISLSGKIRCYWPSTPSPSDRGSSGIRSSPPEENSRARWGDGLVPYASSHVAGTASEFVVTAGHACLANPDVIGKVARILKEHARRCDPPILVPEADGRSREMSQTTAPVDSRPGLDVRPGTNRAFVPARDSSRLGTNDPISIWSQRS